MNKHFLSSSADRVAGAAVAAILSLMMVFLVFLLSKNILSLIIITVCVMLVTAVLIFYVLNLYKAACTPLPQEKKLLVYGFPNCIYDLADAVSVQTVSYQSGALATRTLVFYNADNDLIVSVPTFFFSRQGVMAEPVAQKIAAELDLTFVPSLEPWEYDKDLWKQHQAEKAEKEKEARKAKFQALKNKLLRRPNAEKPAFRPLEEELDSNLFEENADGINYDALDDEK